MYPRHFISLCLIIVLSVLYAPAHAQPFTQVGVGFVHLCGLSADGSVDCRTPSHAKRYEAPDDLPALQALTAGHQHSCGITLNGAAVCWGGDNYFNELDVPAIDQPLVDIVAGQHHTCAIDTNDRMWCWGLDTNGQLQVPGDGLGKEGAGFVKVAANGNATCGIEQNGSIDCWSSDINIRDTSSLTGIFTDLDVSRSMGCGLHDTGDIECWAGFIEPPSNIAVCGLDQNQQIDCSFRQYGDVDTTAHTSETRFISMESGKPIYGFYSNFCGVTVDGDIECIADGFDEVPGTPDAPVDLASLSISLNARFYDRNSIELFWNPSQGYPERTIEIYRNIPFEQLMIRAILGRFQIPSSLT